MFREHLSSQLVINIVTIILDKMEPFVTAIA